MAGDSIKTENVVLQENDIVRNIDGLFIGRLDRDNAIDKLKEENNKLKNFAIWMTGCGYDFTQHEYFCKQRDELLKAGVV